MTRCPFHRVLIIVWVILGLNIVGAQIRQSSEILGRTMLWPLRIDVWLESPSSTWDAIELKALVANIGSKPHHYSPIGYALPFYVEVHEQDGSECSLSSEGKGKIMRHIPMFQNAVGDRVIEPGKTIELSIPLTRWFAIRSPALATVKAFWSSNNSDAPGQSSLPVELLLPERPKVLARPPQDAFPTLMSQYGGVTGFEQAERSGVSPRRGEDPAANPNGNANARTPKARGIIFIVVLATTIGLLWWLTKGRGKKGG